MGGGYAGGIWCAVGREWLDVDVGAVSFIRRQFFTDTGRPDSGRSSACRIVFSVRTKTLIKSEDSKICPVEGAGRFYAAVRLLELLIILIHQGRRRAL